MTGRTHVVMQARMGSSRLSGKTLKKIAGRPMLAHVVERASAIPGVDEVVLAIADGRDDAQLVEFARAEGLRWVQGSERDVLSRAHLAWSTYPADTIVRVSPDCPLLDPRVSGLVVAKFRSLAGNVDYVSNVRPKPTFPDGLDTEVFTSQALVTANQKASKLSDREHWTPFIWRPENGFRLDTVEHTPDLSSERWTVDTAADLEFVSAVYAELDGLHGRFGMDEVLCLLKKKPELRRLNAGQQRNEGYMRSLAADDATEARR